MRVTINGMALRFWFSYNMRATGTALTCVHCSFGEREYKALAECAKSDIFVKKIGRKVALSRLLRVGLVRVEHLEWVVDLRFTREMRSAIWAAYFAKHRDLKTA